MEYFILFFYYLRMSLRSTGSRDYFTFWSQTEVANQISTISEKEGMLCYKMRSFMVYLCQ